MPHLIESTTRPLQVQDSKTLSGVFAITDTFNQNTRKYPRAIYAEAYKELIPKIRERRLLGELDHPTDRDEVFLSNVSHVITECHTETNESGKLVYKGTVELLDTPAGKIAQALVKAGVPIGISSRGVGNTRQVHEGVEVTQLKLITYDLVAEPSFKTAVLSPSQESELAENLSYIEARIPLNESKENDVLRKKINTIRESLRLTEPGVHIEESKVQTIELETLKSLLESKSRTIAEDTKKLKEHRSRAKADAERLSKLQENLKSVNSRYTSIRENHQKLQNAYNKLEESYKQETAKKLSEKEDQIIDLRKRLAVEKRGMSYTQVSSLLEGLRTESEINARLDTVSSMRKKSSVLTESYADGMKNTFSAGMTECRSPLAKVISRV